MTTCRISSTTAWSQPRSLSTDGQTAEPGVSPHATNVCSILMGRDEAGYHEALGAFQYQGLLPDAETLVVEFEAFWLDVILAEG